MVSTEEPHGHVENGQENLKESHKFSEKSQIRDCSGVPQNTSKRMESQDGQDVLQTTPEESASDEKLDNLERQKSIAESLPLVHEIFFVAIITLAQFTTQASFASVLILLHVIGDSFGISDPAALAWLVAGYSLTVGTFILVSGRFGDLYGHKRMLIIGFVWFSITSMMAGLSVYSNDVMFIFARVLQGIGPAITLPNGLAILGATYAPGRRKDMVFSIFAATAPGGAIVGSAFAALLALAWWPWAFWSLAIVLAITAAAAVFVIPDPPKSGMALKSSREKLILLDLPGAFTSVIALILFNFAWNQAPIVGWQQAYVYVLLIISILFAALFFVIETRWAPSPLIPFQAFTNDVAFILFCVACGWASFGIFFYYLFNIVQNLRGASPLLSAAYFAPILVSGALASICTGFLLGRVGPAWVMTMAMTAFTIGSIIAATFPVNQTYWAQIFVAVVIMPWGMDMSFPAGTIILSNAVSKEHQGVAASLVATIVNYSISLGLGFAGTVEVHENNGGKTKSDVLQGYHAAQYVGIGFAVLGLFVSVVFLVKGYLKARTKSQASRSKA